MSTPLRIIIVEDREEDAILMSEALREAGFRPDWTRVDTEQDFRDQLKVPVELILADYLLPQFNGLQALRIAREDNRDIPFIIVSGSIGEDLAVAALQLGADDYLLKDRLTRLGPAVERALAEKQLRDDKRHIAQALRDSEKRFRALIEHSSDVINLLDASGQVLYASPAITSILGYAPEEFVGRNGFDLVHPDDVAREHQDFLRLQQMPRATIQLALRVQHRDGTWRNLEGSATNLLAEPSVRAIVINYRDVTERKQAEFQREAALAALLASEARFRLLFNTSPDAILVLDPHAVDTTWSIIDCNEVACQMNGYTREELIGQSVDLLNVERTTPAEHAEYLARLRREGVIRLESFHRHKDGHLFPIEISTSPFTIDGRELVLGIDRDITERKRAEAALRESERFARATLDALSAHIAILDEHGTLVAVNQAWTEFARANGGTPEQTGVGVNYLAVCDAARGSCSEEAAPFAAGIRDVMAGVRDDFLLEYPCHSAGEERWFYGRVTRFPGDGPVRIAVAHENITERKLAEERVTIASTQLQNLFDNLDDVFFSVDAANSQLLQISPASQAVFGIPPDDFLTNPALWREIIHADYLMQERENQARLFAGQSVHSEYRIVRPDGTVRWVEAKIKPVLDNQHQLRRFDGIIADITDRKQTEQQIADALNFNRTLLEASPIGIIAYRQTGEVVSANEAVAHLIGATVEQVIAQNFHELASWRQSGLLALAEEALTAQRAVEQEIHHHSTFGKDIRINARLVPFSYKSEQHLLGMFTDVTQRQQAEEALRASEGRFRALIENGSDLISILDREGRFVYESPSSIRILGFEPQELIGRSALEFTHPDDLPRLIGALSQIMQSTSGPAIVTEGRFHHKDGSWRYLETISHNLLDDPVINGIVVNARDVTERRAAEQALQHAEVSYRRLFEEMPIGLYRTTAQDEVIDANPALLRLLGFPDRETLFAISADSLYVSNEDRNREREQLLRDQVVRNFEMQLRRYDGTIIWVEDTVRLINGPDGLYYYYDGAMQDVTDRKERERELEAIASVSAALRTARTHAEMLSIVLDQIYALLTVDGASIAMRDPATGESVFEAGRGTGEGYIGRRVPAGVGVIGHVIASGHVYLTNDAPHDPNFFWPHLLGPLQAVACVPLVVQDHTLGALWVGRRTTILGLELRLLEAIGDIAGSAIHRAALYEAERRQRVLAESLRDTAAALSSTLNYDEVLDLILYRAQHVVPHDHARVVLIESGKGYVVRSRGYSAATPGTSFDLDSRPHLKQIQATGRPLIIPDTRDYPGWSNGPELQWVQSYVGMPIRLKGQVAGFLILASAAANFFRSADSERIQAFADQCAIAIENARLYQEVRRYAEELETRVEDRTRELVDANQRLQELDRLKSKFVSDVSHELRTPVTSLSLHAELLETGKPERRDYYLKILQDQARRLNQLVEDILNLSRLELSVERVQFEPVDLNTVVASVVAAHQPSAEVAGLELAFMPDPDLALLQGESNQLAQVITNLVANAINYTRQGRVHVRTSHNDQHISVEVQDTGLGIDPEDLPHLFDRFYRGQQATRSKIRGTGLGLSIVKEIVDLHGGTITVASTVGQGSTFCISFPSRGGAAGSAQPQGEQP